MKRINNKYRRKYEYLPKKLIKKINEVIFSNNENDYRTKNNFLKCIGIIYHKMIEENYDINNYVSLGKDYWYKVYGGDYHQKVIRPLLELGIIQSFDFGYRNNGLVGIRYRINPELTDDDCEIIYYINKGRVLTVREINLNNGQEFLDLIIENKNFHVSINRNKAMEWIEDNANKICSEYLHLEFVNNMPEDLKIEYHEFIQGGTMNTRYDTIKEIKNIAESNNKQFFFFKDSFYVAVLDEFLRHKAESMKYHYKREISKIGVVPLVDQRSEVTLRVYNQLTNFPSKILQFIFINNTPIVQLDLKTSQFLLFANLLNVYLKNGEQGLLKLFNNKRTLNYLKRLIRILKSIQKLLPPTGIELNNTKSGGYSSSDVIKFIRDVFYTDFYEVVQKELNLPERGLAKLVLFKLLFKKGKKADKSLNEKTDILLDKLKQSYPVLMSIIAEFKEQENITKVIKSKKNNSKDKNNKSKKDNSKDGKNQDSNFSVFLQCVESEIFIDKILIPLREQGIPCFTRHDSIVVASGYEKQVEKFIKDVFQKFGFKYKHKIEDMFWDDVYYEELENSGYIDWISDQNEFDDYSNEGGYSGDVDPLLRSY